MAVGYIFEGGTMQRLALDTASYIQVTVLSVSEEVIDCH